MSAARSARRAGSATRSGEGAGVRARCTRGVLAGAGAAGVAIVAGGCGMTTQQTAAMARLNNARTLAGQSDLRVTQAGRVVTPLSVELVRSRHGSAFVVTVRNAGNTTVSDLPISVGYRVTGGRAVYVNSSGSLTYFDKHLPRVLPHRTLTWVFTTARPVPAGAHLFARVGERADPAVPAGATPIRLRVVTKKVTPHALTVVVTNESGLPQYQLQIYTTARRHGRYVAAANLTLAGVNPGVTERVQVPLVGSAAGSRPITTAVPTILNER